ncbi:serine/threonine-protein phosphatase 6 regulatory ankyrin repeat subunit C-like [Haliotis asinina]|uniref:serine/threonine-protein phosphatase 6 regulatory ankyrin repeat subunit C-like n=1 Tax=Haliotis asinina TaxID=109174 RepID=UPI003531D45E
MHMQPESQTPSPDKDQGGHNVHDAENNLTAFKHILSSDDKDINHRGQNGKTAIMCAAQEGNSDMFDLFVAKGADLSILDAGGNNILHYASVGGDVKIMKYIISEHKASINSRDEYQRTPVVLAASYGRVDAFMFLVNQGVDLTLKDAFSNNILHSACYGGNVDIVKYVLSQTPVNINSIDKFLRTPVMWAAQLGHKLVFDLLVDRGGDLKLHDFVGNNILHYACTGGHMEIVKYLLSSNVVDRDGRNSYGFTASAVAKHHGLGSVQELILSQR